MKANKHIRPNAAARSGELWKTCREFPEVTTPRLGCSINGTEEPRSPGPGHAVQRISGHKIDAWLLRAIDFKR
jgi:hypothetical protein